MCWPHVVAANRCLTGPAARYSAYRLNASFSRSRDSNSPTPCPARNSIHSLTARAYTSHVFGAGAPLAGSSRSHRFTATAGRGTPGAVLEQQVVIDQHRHPLRDQRPVADIPGLPALRREEAQDHEPQP